MSGNVSQRLSASLGYILYRLEVCDRAILKAYVLYKSKFKFSKRATKFDEIVQLI